MNRVIKLKDAKKFDIIAWLGIVYEIDKIELDATEKMVKLEWLRLFGENNVFKREKNPVELPDNIEVVLFDRKT